MLLPITLFFPKKAPMKILKWLIIVLLISFAASSTDIIAQPGPPPWAPAHGYRAKARYTYFPSLNFYFDSRAGVYFSLEAGVWQRYTSMPPKYKNYKWANYRYEEFEWSNDKPWEKHYANGKKKSSASPSQKPRDNNGKSKGKGNGKGNS